MTSKTEGGACTSDEEESKQWSSAEAYSFVRGSCLKIMPFDDAYMSVNEEFM